MSDDAAAKRRARQTVINLLLSLAATLAIVLVTVLIVPRDDSNRIQPVDHIGIAAQVQKTTDLPLVAPQLPKGWWSNSARFEPSPADGVATWYAGFVGPKNQYLGLTEAANPNPTWLVQQLEGAKMTGSIKLGSGNWDIYEAPVSHSPKKTKDYIMVLNITKGEKIAVLLYGTGTKADFSHFAEAIDQELQLKLKEGK
jgi:hypothetical protein